jgi:cytochrome c-type biogenesis protein CcmH/NrfF
MNELLIWILPILLIIAIVILTRSKNRSQEEIEIVIPKGQKVIIKDETGVMYRLKETSKRRDD